MIGNNLKRKKGFTLIEILVVLALFTVLGMVIMDVFLLSLRSQRQVSARQKSLVSLRYVMETISRQIRTSQIYYYDPDDEASPRYDNGGTGQLGIDNPEPELYLINQDGNEIAYYQEGGVIKMSINGQESVLTDLDELVIVKFLFYIEPVTDPFADERCNGPEGNNGCLNNLACTLDDDSGSFGFCLCSADSECRTLHCDFEEGVCLPFDQQPKVTVILGFQSKAVKAEEQKTIYLQTTASSRVYKR